ncbi:MAG: diaminopimelate epimerase [Melioribacteraceae bacterium]|nr:diaminopimelate epimerase [Melioribacteraceae bacterium]
MNFTKMNGAGNDFIIIDSINNKPVNLTTERIIELCDRRRGIGADGVLHIQVSEEFDYKLAYFNSNGSLGSLCANGSRCSIKYASENLLNQKKSVSFICNGEVYSGTIIKDDYVKLNLHEPQKIKLNFKIKHSVKDINCNFFDTGSPHAVLFWEDIADIFHKPFMKFDITKFGKEIRNADEFAPEGTNVNLVMIQDDDHFIRTFERGVEDETLSCGTGTVASAIALFLIKNINPPIRFHTFGGEELIVDFAFQNSKINKITLTGPVKINYIGSCNF